ncbi:hypothetical protein Droror1_Dr00011646 [Drosera rotundifolia]
MDFNSKYEIEETSTFIITRNFTRVALQFPDEMLKDSTRVVRAIREEIRRARGGELEGERRVGLFVMADTTYGSCCVDEVGAAHVNADCVVHYGQTCFSQTSTIPAFFVLGKAYIDVSNCATKIREYASTNQKPILVLFGLDYSYAITSIKEALVAETSDSNIMYADVLCSTMDPVKDHVVSDGNQNIFGNGTTHKTCNPEARTKCHIGGLTWSLPLGHKIEDFLLFWIGPESAAFTNVVLRFNNCKIVRYDATNDHLVTDLYQQRKILKQRYYLVEKAKDANMVGVLVGTLGVAGYLHMIHQMKNLITRAGKKAYLLVMGRPNPAKLANFPECDIFVYVSCEQTALIDSKEFYAPIITPFEAVLAFSREHEWTGEYTMEFRNLIGSSFNSQNSVNAARFSFFKGGFVEDLEDEEDGNHEDDASALVVAAEKALQLRESSQQLLVRGIAKSGAEFLVAARSYQGLEVNYEDSQPSPVLVGRVGKASGYESEKRQQ